MGTVQRIIIISQSQYRNILDKSLGKDVVVVEWLVFDDVKVLSEIVSKIDVRLDSMQRDKILVCIMVCPGDMKNALLFELNKRIFIQEQLFDVYQSYMARFPRKRYQRIMNRRLHKKLDGLVLGISHGMTAIDEDLLPGEVCNLCESSQDIYFNCKVMEHMIDEYYEQIKELKYVVIDMFDYTYFNFDTIQTGAYEPFLENSGFLCESRMPWLKEKSVEDINEDIARKRRAAESESSQRILDSLFPNIMENGEDAYKGEMVLKERKKTLSDEVINRYMNRPTYTSIQLRVFEKTIEFQIDNFEKLIQLIRGINPNINILLLLLPKFYGVEEQEKIVNATWKDFFYQVIEEVQSKYSRVYFMDEKENIDFSARKDLYQDLTHFNYNGAEEFSNYLSDVIKNYNIMEI